MTSLLQSGVFGKTFFEKDFVQPWNSNQIKCIDGTISLTMGFLLFCECKNIKAQAYSFFTTIPVIFVNSISISLICR